MLKAAVPNVFVSDFQQALAYYTGPLGFRELFVYGEPPFYGHVVRGEAILALRHVTKKVIDHSAGQALLSAYIELTTEGGVDDLAAEFQASGADIWQSPRNQPWGGRELIVADPDGNLISFAELLRA